MKKIYFQNILKKIFQVMTSKTNWIKFQNVYSFFSILSLVNFIIIIYHRYYVFNNTIIIKNKSYLNKSYGWNGFKCEKIVAKKSKCEMEILVWWVGGWWWWQIFFSFFFVHPKVSHFFPFLWPPSRRSLSSCAIELSLKLDCLCMVSLH